VSKRESAAVRFEKRRGKTDSEVVGEENGGTGEHSDVDLEGAAPVKRVVGVARRSRDEEDPAIDLELYRAEGSSSEG